LIIYITWKVNTTTIKWFYLLNTFFRNIVVHKGRVVRRIASIFTFLSIRNFIWLMFWKHCISILKSNAIYDIFWSLVLYCKFLQRTCKVIEAKILNELHSMLKLQNQPFFLQLTCSSNKALMLSELFHPLCMLVLVLGILSVMLPPCMRVKKSVEAVLSW
jgi:hypothetical protein